MRITTYTVTWNEELRLPWYLDHYSFADQHYIFDNHSTDKTVEIARANPKCTVVPFGTNCFSDLQNLQIKNNCWKTLPIQAWDGIIPGYGKMPNDSGEIEWAIVTDVDEHLHPNPNNSIGYAMLDLLEHYSYDEKNRAFLPDTGYELISSTIPEDYKTINKGYFSPGHCKPSLLRPESVIEMNYTPGCHEAHPMFRNPRQKMLRSPDFVMYHYQYVGMEELIARYAERATRLSAENKKYGWGYHVAWPREKFEAVFAEQYEVVK